MKKINFEDAKLIQTGYVEIDNVQYEVHEAEYESPTPLSSYVLNTLQDNIEEELNLTNEEVNIVKEGIKNLESLKIIEELDVTKLLRNGWVQHAKCQIFKENNIVHILLCVKEGTTNTIMALPQGFRPSEAMYFPCNTQEATTANYCSISNSGNINCANGLIGKLLFINISFKV